ncbi:MAG: alpha/beta fold hydrolase [Bryobacterales bacterium]|nr:alpha/beta fold hydrolase [Bryobacterales bacterium]
MSPNTARRIALASILLMLFCAAGAVLGEGGINVPPQFRITPTVKLAESIARQTAATWMPAEITAADGVALRAWLFRPRKANGKGVIALHGVVDSRRGALGDARILLQHGYTVLTPDSRAHGESGGIIMTYGIRETADVRLWAGYLARQERVTALYAVGHSMGASILLQAIGPGTPFRAVVAESPFATFRDVAYDRVGGILHIRPVSRFLLWPIIEPAFAYTRLRHGIDLSTVSPLDAIGRTTVPVLLIHGTADENIPISHSRALHAANPRMTQLWEVPGAPHVAAPVVRPQEYEQRILKWFSDK